MRTNMVIDDKLLHAALRASGLPTKRAVVEEALRVYVQLKAQTGIRQLRGKVKWEGDLHACRLSRLG